LLFALTRNTHRHAEANSYCFVNLREFDGPPPGEGLTTVTVAVPAVAMAAPEIDTVSWMALTKAVFLADPFHCTLDPLMKFLPLTTSVRAGAPAVALEGSRLLIVGHGLSRLPRTPQNCTRLQPYSDCSCAGQ